MEVEVCMRGLLFPSYFICTCPTPVWTGGLGIGENGGGWIGNKEIITRGKVDFAAFRTFNCALLDAYIGKRGTYRSLAFTQNNAKPYTMCLLKIGILGSFSNFSRV